MLLSRQPINICDQWKLHKLFLLDLAVILIHHFKTCSFIITNRHSTCVQLPSVLEMTHRQFHIHLRPSILDQTFVHIIFIKHPTLLWLQVSEQHLTLSLQAGHYHNLSLIINGRSDIFWLKPWSNWWTHSSKPTITLFMPFWIVSLSTQYWLSGHNFTSTI